MNLTFADFIVGMYTQKGLFSGSLFYSDFDNTIEHKQNEGRCLKKALSAQTQPTPRQEKVRKHTPGY